MPEDLAFITRKLYTTIVDAMTSASSATPEGAAGGAFVTTESPATVIDPVQFANPWSPVTPQGSQTALESFSALVDPVPQLSRSYASSGRSTEDVYALALGAVAADAAAIVDERATSPPADVDVGAALELARLTNARNNAAARTALLSAASVENASLATVVPAASAAPAEISSAPEVLRAFRTANAVFARTVRARVDDPTLSYHPAYATPLNFAGSADDWSSVALPLSGLGATASFRFLRIDVARPWLNLALFSLAGWRVEGVARGGFSTGEITNNPGLLPLVTTALVGVRDVVIRYGETTVLKVPGIRIVARINSVIPLSPRS